MLFSQGISTAEELAGRIVLLFQLCEEQLSSQSHYDFGLRALKSVLVGAGGLKRKALQEAALSGTGIGKLAGAGEQAAGLGDDAALLGPVERDVLIRFCFVLSEGLDIARAPCVLWYLRQLRTKHKESHRAEISELLFFFLLLFLCYTATSTPLTKERLLNTTVKRSRRYYYHIVSRAKHRFLGYFQVFI